MKAIFISLTMLFAINASAMFRIPPSMLAQSGLIVVKFLCHPSGPSGAWLDKDVAWNMQISGWHEIHGNSRTYYKALGTMNEALAIYKQARKETFLKYCVDQSDQVIAYRAKCKAKRQAEARLVNMEQAIKDLQNLHKELNEAYKELVEMYKHPQINPEYKKAIEALTKRIQLLEDHKKTLESTVTP